MTACTNCQHQNEDGKFCEKCGNSLTTSTESIREVSATTEAQPVSGGGQGSQYLEEAKKMSKMYFTYFLEVLKKPYASSVNVGEEHFLNGIITMVLYSLFIPLMLFFALKGVLAEMSGFASEFLGEQDISVPFSDVVLMPTLAYVIFILLVACFTFASVKLGRVDANFKEVISRFGSFLIPSVAILAIALILSILKVKLFIFIAFIGFLTSIFLVPPLVIASFKKQTKDGVDVIYGSFITYVLTFVAIAIMGDMLFESLKGVFSELMGGMFY
ncbi:zinc ribbon domain-containing protein [Bacillus weihaiensis]|uniref:zinc ribbon domain-containing protein n=1 Tax=Bacillus weihaiensis TaxID=1547283 RepID=UPI00235450E0|nr:zinc ribbon domain-containing protein [Bacillus weihaiensis]